MEELPQKLRPYHFHGLRFSRPRNDECSADCPFCGREGKFSVNVITGQWRCWVCATGTARGGGNAYTFIRELHAQSFEGTGLESYKELAQDRKLLDAASLIEWNLAKSVTTDDWIIPGYNQSKQLTTLYRYLRQSNGGYRFIPTPTLGHHIHGLNLWDSSKPIVYICEGPWDGIALWEVLTRCKNSSEGHELVETASRESSLYSQANVMAVPGCEVFFESWLPLFEGKIVNLMYDSDHPRKHPKTGHMSPGAGWSAMRRVTELFVNSPYKPEELNCLVWGQEGYDPTKKSGYDIRDFLTTN